MTSLCSTTTIWRWQLKIYRIYIYVSLCIFSKYFLVDTIIMWCILGNYRNRFEYRYICLHLNIKCTWIYLKNKKLWPEEKLLLLSNLINFVTFKSTMNYSKFHIFLARINKICGIIELITKKSICQSVLCRHWQTK